MTSSRAGPTPTTAGMPMERAMMEACEVLDPHRRVLGGVFLTDGEHRRLGTLQVSHTLLDRRGKLGVPGHLHVEIEDAGLLFAPRSAQFVSGLREAGGDSLDGLFEPLQLGLYLILRYSVPLGLGLACSWHERRPYGHSFRCSNAGQLHSHGPGLVFAGHYQLGQRLHSQFGVLALRADGDLIAFSGEPGNLQDALGVHFPVPLHDNDLRGEPLGRLYEPRRRPAVDTFLRTYRRLSLCHEISSRARASLREPANRPNDTPTGSGKRLWRR